jgi:hypothetical protein
MVVVDGDFSKQVGSTPALGRGLSEQTATMDVVMNGQVKTVPYRNAVSLVSRRLARWATETTGVESETSHGPTSVEPPAAQGDEDETPATPAQPVGLEPPYDGYTAAALVAELERRELPTSAKNKAELVDRLADSDEDLIGMPGSTPTGDAADTTEDEPSPSDE